MPRQLHSTEFTRLYDDLPAAVQRTIVEKQLIPLLNLVHAPKARKIITQTSKALHAHKNLPQVDLQAKKVEVNGLLDELAKDAKCSFIKDRSNREVLLREVVESIAGWLNSIWSLVYEHALDFTKAHSCLLFSIGVLDHVQTVRGGCKCSFSTMYVPVIIWKKSGKAVKSFMSMGLENVESAILWVWRDLFVSLLASGHHTLTKLVPELLSDIDDIVGWQGLEKLLCGGRKPPLSDDEDDEDFDDFSDDDGEVEDDDDDDDDDDAAFHASHWTFRIDRQVVHFRHIVHNRMMAIFKTAPSFLLYSSLLTLGISFVDTQAELFQALSSIATVSGSALAAAIEIYSFEGNAGAIAELLSCHSHLLRPRDAPMLQIATRTLSLFPAHHARALQIVEKELVDCARTIHAALLPSFRGMDTPAQRAEAAAIAKLRQGTTARSERVERWVENAVTPGTAPANPMAFAAIMMGFPLTQGMQDPDDADPMGVLDMAPQDPDFADLREEFRPNIKDRFEGWSDTAESISGGQVTLLKVYKEILELMPLLRASDIVEEMIGRLADKPSKHHVCDALDMLSVFTKAQKKKHSTVYKQRKAKDGRSPLGLNAGGSTSSTPVVGGMEELD